jgi:hypothetical protein
VSILADLFVADEREAHAYDKAAGEGTEPPYVKREQFRGLLDLNFSILWAILDDLPWNLETHSLESVARHDGGERWLFRFPSALTRELSVLDDASILKAAQQWAKTEELQCQPNEVQPVIAALVALSRKAVAEGKAVYLWGSL